MGTVTSLKKERNAIGFLIELDEDAIRTLEISKKNKLYAGEIIDVCVRHRGVSRAFSLKEFLGRLGFDTEGV